MKSLKKGVPRLRGTPARSLFRVAVAPALLALALAFLHFLLHIVKFLFLLVGQDFANLGVRGLAQAAAFGHLVFARHGLVLHDLTHLAARVFQDGLYLGLLLVIEAEPLGESLYLVFDAGHTAAAALIVASALWRRILLRQCGCRQRAHGQQH